MNEAKIFTKEDRILYAFTAVLVIAVSLFFFRAESRQQRLISEAYKNEVGSDLTLQSSDSLELSFYKAQTQMNNKLIGYSSRSIVAASSIKYMAFLIGMVMIFLGSIMIIRGIRLDPSEISGDFKDQIKLRVLSSSPGVILSFLGTVILITSILKDAGVDLNNFQVRPYRYVISQKNISRNDSCSLIVDPDATGLGDLIGGKP